MAKILNVLIGTIGILYICGQVTYYGIVQLLSAMGYIHAATAADSHKIIWDWVIFMAFLLVIFNMEKWHKNTNNVKDQPQSKVWCLKFNKVCH